MISVPISTKRRIEMPTTADASRAATPTRQQGRAKLRLLGLSMTVITAGFCAASVLTLHDLRQSTYNQAVSGEINLLNALSQDIARNIETYDLSLQAVVEGLSEPKLPSLLLVAPSLGLSS